MTALSLTRPDALQPSAPPPPLRLAVERARDRAAVDALIDRAFGPGRFAKTAERLREGAEPHPELSICAWLDGELAGAVRLWPARIGAAPVLFLGPIAVEREVRRHGVGGELVAHACARAAETGEAGVVLVGDLGFFGPLGFEPAPTGRVALPGPVDPRRVLWKALVADALDHVSGLLTLARAA